MLEGIGGAACYMTETRIVSFILRFVQPESGERVRPWHGVVRHVQSQEEMRFTEVAEALQFMQQYVQLEDDLGVSLLPSTASSREPIEEQQDMARAAEDGER
jgi:hypothetical protein